MWGPLKYAVNTRIGKSTFKALDILIDELSSLIGTTSDTGGTDSAGTVMAKLNGLYPNRLHGYQEFTTAGTFTWTCPEGVKTVYVTGYGGTGGGGGGGAGKDSFWRYGRSGRGGSGGGVGPAIRCSVPVTPGETYTIVVGAAGKAGSAGKEPEKAGSNGGNGGDTKFGSAVTIPGGYGGKGGGGGNGSDDNSASSPAVSGGESSGSPSITAVFRVNVDMILSPPKASEASPAPGVQTSTGLTAVSKGTSGQTLDTFNVSAGSGGAGGRTYIDSTSGGTNKSIAGSTGSAGKVGFLSLSW